MTTQNAEVMAPAEPIRVMLVDDHEVVRDSLREMLDRAGGFKTVGEAGDAESAVSMALDLNPDVIVMDVWLPARSGIDACREIAELLPGTRLLILTANTEEDAVVQAVAAGAVGYVKKHATREQLLAAIRDVAAGEYRIPGDVIRRVFSAALTTADYAAAQEHLRKLSTLELDTLLAFAQGQSYADIARSRGVRPSTVRNTMHNAQSKLGIKTKQEMVALAVQSGLLKNPQSVTALNTEE